MIKAVNNTKTWIRRNWISIILSFLLLGVIIFHFYGTYNPPITQAIIVSPKTKDQILPNGQYVQTKTNTPSTSNPYMSGFSEEFVKDTIGKVLGIKEKEILAINQVKGSYVDSLQFVREELDEQKKLTKLYQSKDSKGNVVGTGKVTDGMALVYKGNIDLSIIKKDGTKDKRGNQLIPSSLVFYDPTQRVTIGESKEYTYTLPQEPKKLSKFKFGVQGGVGAVAPIRVDNGKVKLKDLGLGVYVGTGVIYTF